MHRVAGWLCVIVGLLLIVVGVWRRFGIRAAIVFGALAVTSTPIINIATALSARTWRRCW